MAEETLWVETCWTCSMCGVLTRYIQVLHALNISVVPAYSIAIYCYYTQSHNHYISLLTTCYHRSCVERQSSMSKRKFQEELARHVEEPFLPHLVPELEMKEKKQNLPPPLVIGRRPFLDIRLSWMAPLKLLSGRCLTAGQMCQLYHKHWSKHTRSLGFWEVMHLA